VLMVKKNEVTWSAFNLRVASRLSVVVAEEDFRTGHSAPRLIFDDPGNRAGRWGGP
jgi:hypothetical protein